MKYCLLLLSVIVLSSCAEKPLDEAKSRAIVEELIEQTNKGDFKRIEEIYAPSFLESESMEVKKQKLDQLKETLGDIQSVEFLKSTSVAEFGQPQQMKLEYRIKHSRVNTIEKFTVVEEEGGYKVSAYSVETEYEN